MTSAGRTLVRWMIAGALCWTWGVAMVPAQSATPQDPALQAARFAYDAIDYEAARTQLDAIIASLTGQALTPASRTVLAAAYELRGRTLQNLRDIEGAREDFRLMLLLRPDYPFPPEAGARAMALFEEVRAATVGFVEVDATPVDARVSVDDQPLDRPARVWLVEGAHTVTVERPGYAPTTETFTVVPGEPNRVAVMLERIASALSVVTLPAGVDVRLNGAPRGETPAAPGIAPVASSPTGVPPVDAPPSGRLVLEGLPLGVHTLEFSRTCYLPQRVTVEIQRHDDIRLDPVRLERAVGTIAVRSDPAGAQVVLDGIPQGDAPQEITACEGPHTVEVRTGAGRDLRRLTVKAKEAETFTGVIRPAIALLAHGSEAASRLLDVEAAFATLPSIKLFVPSGDRGQTAAPSAPSAAPSQAPSADWLSVDATGRLAASADAAAARATAVTTLVRDVQVQGVGVLAQRDEADGESRLFIFAPGSGRPDDIRWPSGEPDGVDAVLTRLAARPALTQPSLGMLAIEVVDAEGVVIAVIDADGPAAAAGLQRGDTIVSAGGAPVGTVAALRAAAVKQPADQPLPLQVRDAAGVTRAVNLSVAHAPRVVDPGDRTVLSNVMAIDLTARLRVAASPLERTALRLNLAAAWMQLENWTSAMRELDAVAGDAAAANLPASVRDAVTGTAQYLLGVAAARNGDTAAAQRAWTAAGASSGDLLTGGAMPVRDLAARGLEALGRP